MTWFPADPAAAVLRDCSAMAPTPSGPVVRARGPREAFDWRAGLRVCVGVVVGTIVATCAARGQESAVPALFTLVLRDGTSVSSYGEWARVGDRVVFSLPTSEVVDVPTLHLASLPSAEVDWEATERARDAVRAARYAATRGDADFARLTSDIALLLNDAAAAPDPSRKLAAAREARRRLLAWPADHFGYRLDEVRQIAGLVDEVIDELRAAAGEDRFALSFVATTAPPPPVVLPPRPTLQESIGQVLSVARRTDATAERLSLLRTAVVMLDEHEPSLPPAWREATRAAATADIVVEVRTDRQYASLGARVLARAARAASRADVRGVERTLRELREADARLGARRPAEVAGLVAAIDARLDAARRLRLARDRWASKAPALRAYARAVRRPLDELARARPLLDDIRALAGPAVDDLTTLEARMARLIHDVAGITTPPDVAAPHAVLTSGLQLADHAVRLRREAIRTGDLRTAWDASAAAAGALLLLDRARDDVARAVAPPTSP
ncbi:MAG: hypothetical protein KJ066_04665 [Acidobacteria bacterium]|nr:hypothetical protein [Acidobacteriota bacterium]